MSASYENRLLFSVELCAEDRSESTKVVDRLVLKEKPKVVVLKLERIELACCESRRQGKKGRESLSGCRRRGGRGS